MNYYDRTILASVIEPIKDQFALTDGQVGLLASAFTMVFAVSGSCPVGWPTPAHGAR